MPGADVDVIRRALAAFASRDLEALGRLLADDVRWHTPGDNLLAGDFRGRDDVLAYLDRVLRLTGDTMEVRPVDLLAGDDHVAALVDVSGRRRGRVLHDRSIQLFRVIDGLIVERRLYPADQRETDRFWAP